VKYDAQTILPDAIPFQTNRRLPARGAQAGRFIRAEHTEAGRVPACLRMLACRQEFLDDLGRAHWISKNAILVNLYTFCIILRP